MPRKICLSAGLVTLILVGLLASGCGGSKKAATTTSTSAGTTTTPTVDSTVAAEVPVRDQVEGHTDRRRRRHLCSQRVHR